jgi:hypothetical protein
MTTALGRLTFSDLCQLEPGLLALRHEADYLRRSTRLARPRWREWAALTARLAKLAGSSCGAPPGSVLRTSDAYVTCYTALLKAAGLGA